MAGERERSDRLVEEPGANCAVAIEAMDERAVDVHPVESLLFGAPNRAFAAPIGGGCRAAGLKGVHGEYCRAGICEKWLTGENARPTLLAGGYPQEMDRRAFLAMAAVAAAGRATERGMQLHLSCGALGIKANQRQAVELAAKHGFDAVDADGKYLGGLSDGELSDLTGFMKSKNVAWAMSGLPVEFRKDDATFNTGMAAFPTYARGLKRAGVRMVTTWVLPMSNDSTYLANFRIHATRLRAAARVLGDNGLRFGMEYVAPKTLWASQRYSFVHTMAEMRELLAEIGATNTGLVLDSWHWYHAGDSAADILGLKASDVVSVDLNDAPAGVAKDQMVDGKRELPATTGVIGVKSFLGALQQIGFAGPVRAEPFNDAVRQMASDDAAEAAHAALLKAFAA
jgi:sugar phosphate isomerase/epimerase